MTLTMSLFHTADGDRYGPLVTCDHCGRVIEAGSNGNVEYKVDRKTGAVELGGAIGFTHKACCLPWETAHGGRGAWYTENLDVFVIYLGNGLKLDWDKARIRAAMLGSI